VRISRASLSLALILLGTLPFVGDAYADSVITWTADSGLDNLLNGVTRKSGTHYWYSNGWWDVMGLEFWDPAGDTDPSDFSYTWQDGIVKVWVADYDTDWRNIGGGTGGLVRQGSAWDPATAPWYDQTTYQPSPLRFAPELSSVILRSRVKVDSVWRESTDIESWINWLFNPWFNVWSCYKGVWRWRKICFDICWMWSSTIGVCTVHKFVDSEENFHWGCVLSDQATEGGGWKEYQVDLLQLARQACTDCMQRHVGEEPDPWIFATEDLYLWSIDVCVEGKHYSADFSVDNIWLCYTMPSEGGGPGTGCPWVSVWNGTNYVFDNNLIPAAEHSNGTDVIDYYNLQQPVARYEGKYSLLILDTDKHSFLDHVQLLAVDHKNDVNIGVSPYGKILTYKSPASPVTALSQDGEDLTSALSSAGGGFFEGYPGDYVLLEFGSLDVSKGAKLVARADWCDFWSCKESVHVQVLNATGEWANVASFIPRAYWSTEIIDLSDYLADANGDIKARLYFTAHHSIDYVGLDTSKQGKFETCYANLATANHSRLGDVKEPLARSDDQRVELLPSESITLGFTLPQNTEEKRDFIIVVEGHYFIIA